MQTNKNGSSEKVNIKYIAKVAGVSLSTVSRALRNDPKAKKKTIERIQKIADDLHYYPDLIAKGLRQNKTNTIGIIFNDLNNPFYTEILSVIGELLNERGYFIIISYSHYDSEREMKNIINMLSKRVDGIIFSPIDDRSKNIDLLVNSNVEFVLLDCFPYFENISYVYSQHAKGAVLATEHLIHQGHKDILLLTGPSYRAMADQFITSYKNTLKKHKIAVNNNLIICADDFTIDSGCEAFKKVLTTNVNLTGVVTISDLLAIGIYKASNELGFSIPGTYSVIGYDNIEITSMLSPPLTTVHQPRKRIGAESIKLLLSNIENEQKERKVIALEPYLIKRGSVKNLQ
jgi:LacI family transcriptional regulator